MDFGLFAVPDNVGGSGAEINRVEKYFSDLFERRRHRALGGGRETERGFSVRELSPAPVLPHQLVRRERPGGTESHGCPCVLSLSPASGSISPPSWASRGEYQDILRMYVCVPIYLCICVRVRVRFCIFYFCVCLYVSVCVA